MIVIHLFINRYYRNWAAVTGINSIILIFGSNLRISKCQPLLVELKYLGADFGTKPAADAFGPTPAVVDVDAFV